jgi:hypothetical protein
VKKMQGEGPPGNWLTVWEKATRIMKDLAMRLRLSPQSRQANNPTRPQRLSYFQRAALAEESDEE